MAERHRRGDAAAPVRRLAPAARRCGRARRPRRGDRRDAAGRAPRRRAEPADARRSSRRRLTSRRPSRRRARSTGMTARRPSGRWPRRAGRGCGARPSRARSATRRQMKNRLIGSSSPLTTCTPTSSEITGSPGIIATIALIDDHRRDDVRRTPAPPRGGARRPSRSRATPRPRRRSRSAGSRTPAGSRRAGRCRTASRRTGRRTGSSARAASAAEAISWTPCVNSVAPVAITMKAAIRFANTAPDDRLAFLVAQLVLAHAALDDRRLQVQLHVWGDRRARRSRSAAPGRPSSSVQRAGTTIALPTSPQSGCARIAAIG